MLATSLATHHRCQPRGFDLRMRLAPTQYEYKLLITLVVEIIDLALRLG